MERADPKPKESPDLTQTPDPHQDFDDNRKLGDWTSIYPISAWAQIALEFVYLFALLLLCSYLLIFGASILTEMKSQSLQERLAFGVLVSEPAVKWIALSISGMLGGLVFDFKWLYHSVANKKWHRDRVLWRLIVPFNSAMVSLFTGFLFASGVIPFLRNETFSEIYTLLGLGFVFGYFSDNILGAMQNLAKEMFGTLRDND